MRRASNYALVAAIAVLMLAVPVFAEEAARTATTAGGGNPADSFPASLGYGALAVVTAVWGTLTAVIAKLYYGREEERKAYLTAIESLRNDNQAEIASLKQEHQKAIEDNRKEHHAAIEEAKKACQAEITLLRDRLETEKDDRLREQEKLLREQKDIMREVMTTCSQVATALAGNTAALEKLMNTYGGGT